MTKLYKITMGGILHWKETKVCVKNWSSVNYSLSDIDIHCPAHLPRFPTGTFDLWPSCLLLQPLCYFQPPQTVWLTAKIIFFKSYSSNYRLKVMTLIYDLGETDLQLSILLLELLVFITVTLGELVNVNMVLLNLFHDLQIKIK